MLPFSSKINASFCFFLTTVTFIQAFHAPAKRNYESLLSMSAQTRRSFGVSFLTIVSLPRVSHAIVSVDPDRYGDKELKIATVNKVRQNVRNSILQSPTLAPLFLKIALQDALTYNPKTNEYGPDGTIVEVILSKNAPASLIPLQPAAQALKDIARKIKRTTEITMADMVTFAGAEAIESVGGPRIVVQLGKADPRKFETPKSYPNLFEGKSSEVVTAFQESGLTEREVALLYGAIGEMEIAASTFKLVKEEVEENEMGDVDVYVPTSFGAPSQIYGQAIGRMDGTFLKTVVKDMKEKKTPSAAVFSDDKVAGWAVKYASGKKPFADLPEAYEKLMGLGTVYTGGKVGSLLGGKEKDF